VEFIEETQVFFSVKRSPWLVEPYYMYAVGLQSFQEAGSKDDFYPIDLRFDNKLRGFIITYSHTMDRGYMPCHIYVGRALLCFLLVNRLLTPSCR